MAIPVTSAPRPETPPANRPPANAPPTTAATPPVRLPSRLSRDVGGATVRVLLSANTTTARIASPGGLVLTDRDGGLLARVSSDERWSVERQGGSRRIRAV